MSQARSSSLCVICLLSLLLLVPRSAADAVLSADEYMDQARSRSELPSFLGAVESPHRAFNVPQAGDFAWSETSTATIVGSGMTARQQASVGITSVPEPAGLVLMGTGLVALGLLRRRRLLP